ncbi:hypothetical protein BSZ39_08770 [Bowdeniella nasicola]|uniref:beta-N-acetylhexosaminidase n=1 Tax=Bowdeniella nasicola TaxID=208480 RepID=A0A1Q5Q1W4_9ACTO|nr:family 20 glycosylhydrolase [Bowdeniella nasicola]OKL53580.1 hypothetical protein BSZ39_08770 [Bowdeniella nasicola]
MFTTAAMADEPAKNVALASEGATPRASGQEVAGQWGPDKLNDGVVNPGAAKPTQSRWSSPTKDNEHATITFAQAHKLDHINVVWESACAPTFSILGSTDGTTFDKPIVDKGTRECVEPLGEADPQTYAIPAELKNEAFKAIRVVGHERRPIGGVKYGFSIWEIEAWTGAEPTPPPPPANPVALVPLPSSVTPHAEADPFTLTPDAKIVAPGEARQAGEFLATIMRASTGYALPVVDSGDTAGNIVLSVTADAKTPEGYALKVSSDGITATGNSAHGVFNAVQTIRQLFPAMLESKHEVNAEWIAAAVDITDAPRFAHRGVQLDPARSFVTVAEVKKVIDTMAAYKLNRLHLHLADDQGWRIEITNDGRVAGDDIDYTRLTSISGQTAMNAHGGQIGHSELGRTGYYTQADYKEIVKYAADRHVTVIPEIDVPGHTNAALHAIPQLNTAGASHQGTPEQPTAPANGTGSVGYSYLDPDSEVSFTFLTHVFKQIAAMTPGEFIHMGGDESHDMTRRHGHAKYAGFLDRVVTILHDLGKKPIGWNEVHEANLKPGDTIQYWVGDPAPVRAAVKDKGARLIVSLSTQGAYLDQKYNAKTPYGLSWARTGDFDVFYSWDPKAAVNLSDDTIRGVEAPMWSEAIRGGDQVEFMAFMRSISIAEMGWTAQNQRDVNDFKQRMAYQGPRLTANNVQFFDGPTTTWQTSLAGTNSSAKPGKASTFNVALLSAPGTVTDGKTISPDTRNDKVNTPSKSVIGAGSEVTVDWGDGTQSAATVETNLPRSAFNSAGLYYLTGKHAYAKAGTYDATVTVGSLTTKLTITVGADQADPKPLRPAWDSSAKPVVSVERDVVRAGDRDPLSASGFEPNVRADIFLGETKLGQLRPDADGTRDFAIQIPPGTPPGKYPLRVVQGERSASTEIIVFSDSAQLPHPIAQDALSIAGFSSQADNETPPNGLATAAIDGKKDTFWHSRWQAPAAKAPHYLDIKLPSTCQVLGVEHTPRADSANGRVKDYAVYVSADGATWSDPVVTGSLPSTNAPTVIPIKPTAGSFVRFEMTSNHAGNDFATIGELRIGGLCDGQEAASVSATSAAGSITASEIAPAKTPLKVTAGEEITLAGSHFNDAPVLVWDTSGAKPVLVASPTAANGAYQVIAKVPADVSEGDTLTWRVTQTGIGTIELPLEVVKKSVDPEPSPTPDPTEEPSPTPDPTDEPTAAPTGEPTTPAPSASAKPSPSLPITGSDAGWALALVTMLAGAGLTLVLRARRMS